VPNKVPNKLKSFAISILTMPFEMASAVILNSILRYM
jgi:hypothetical protein